MLRTFATMLALMLSLFAGKSSAQDFDNFRSVGEVSAVSAGFITGLSLDPAADSGTLSYLNVAGLSTVFTINLIPSESIRDSLPVFMPTEEFGDNLRSLDLDGIQFFTAQLSDPDGGSLPPYWFRLTRFNGEWSGVFRVADRIYAIDRLSESNIVDVRYTPSTKSIFQPAKRVKISAVIDEEYLQYFSQASTQNSGQLAALESIHIMDGLLADSLGLTILLEQVIYQPSTKLSATSQTIDIEAGATDWLDSNSNTFGLSDNLVTLFFREAVNQNIVDHTADNGLVNSQSIIQGGTPHYQFSTAHYFGDFLGLDNEANTIQDWQTSETALPAVHWSEQQSQQFSQNPPAAEFTQTLSYDAPEVTKPAPEPAVPVNEQLIDADSHEAQPGLLNDGEVSTQSGGGSLNLFMVGWMCLLLLANRQRRYITLK